MKYINWQVYEKSTYLSSPADTDLHGGDLRVVVPIKQGNGFPAQQLLHVALLVELGVDDLRRAELRLPRLRAGVQVTTWTWNW